MPSRYFENLPHLMYGNTYCKDITRRVVVTDTATHTPFVFHPYELQHDLRSDQLSEFYFEDSDLDWLVYHSNDIIDPYYQWYLSERNFQSFITDKYGSIEQSQKQIKFYRNDWATDKRELDVSFYNTNLDGQYKKYWRPNFGQGGKIVSYSRREDNTTMNTNRILCYTISANNGIAPFEDGELVDINLGVDTVAVGEMCFSNSTMIKIKNVSGNTTANTTLIKEVVGETSGANVSANAVSTVYENFNEEEGAYWQPVYFFDEEQACNESRKHMILPDLAMTDVIVQSFYERVNIDTDFATKLPID